MSSIIEFLAQIQLFLFALGLIVAAGGFVLLLLWKIDTEQRYSALPGMYVTTAGICIALAYPLLLGIDFLLGRSMQS